MDQPSPQPRTFARLTRSGRPVIECHSLRTLARAAVQRSLPQTSIDDRKETRETNRSDPSAGNCPATIGAAPVFPDLQTAREPERVRAGKTRTRSASRFDLLREWSEVRRLVSPTMILRHVVLDSFRTESYLPQITLIIYRFGD